MSIRARLQQLNITLPPAPKPVAAYVPFVRTSGAGGGEAGGGGNLVYISGQVPFTSGGGQIPPEYLGRVPSQVPVETACRAARQCVLNALSVLSSAIAPADGPSDGASLDQVARIVRLGVFVCCDADFTGQPKVANGASELVVDIFGDRGRHARAAVGSIALPLGVCVEVEMIAELT